MFDFDGVVFGGEPHAAREPAEMGIDGQPGYPESVTEYHVCGFAPDSCQFHQFIECSGHFSVVVVCELAGEFDDRFRFGAVESEGLDIGFYLFFGGGGEGGRIRVAGEGAPGLLD